LHHLSIRDRRANHPILATKVHRGIPAQNFIVYQAVPKGDKGSLVRSLGTKMLVLCVIRLLFQRKKEKKKEEERRKKKKRSRKRRKVGIKDKKTWT